MIHGKKRLVLSLFIFISACSEALASTPTQQIQETIQRVVNIVNEATERGEAEKRELLRQALLPRFDFVEMAKRALGKHWNSVPGRQQEFVAAFAEFLGNAYVGKIVSYKDEKIIFVRESMDKENAQVDTQVIPSKGEPFPVNYRLHQVQGEWKIYDVVVEQVSLVNNYRSQFNRVLTSGSFDDLMKLLKEKGSQQGI
ncbi:MAG: MlaC/ttg2D family ABC transporter substrate-binding protein [Candidatus Binatia bacterium]